MNRLCPLCEAAEGLAWHEDRRRSYYRCTNCHLVFVPPEQYLNAEQEKAEYDLHENDPADAGYRTFLSRLFLPLSQRLPSAARGLDFGCGPGPALEHMFSEAGFSMALYDPVYAPDRAVLQEPYDFITATEVVEHLHYPGREMQTLYDLLRPGGWLGVMTKLVRDVAAFSGWHYKNDLTHVCFWSKESFGWLAGHFGYQLQFIGNDVVLLQKPMR